MAIVMVFVTTTVLAGWIFVFGCFGWIMWDMAFGGWRKPAGDDPPKPSKSTLFMCPACGDGPWHQSWGRICPNCSGAD